MFDFLLETVGEAIAEFLCECFCGLLGEQFSTLRGGGIGSGLRSRPLGLEVEYPCRSQELGTAEMNKAS